MAPLNILIIGAGIAGPTLATFLLLTPEPPKEKPHITILERAPSVRPHGQNIDIRGAGVIVIRKLGLTSTIKANTTGEKGVQHVDAQNRVWAALEAGKGGAPTSDVEILRGRLAEVMVEKCREVSDDVKRQGGAGVDFVFGDYVADIEELGDKASVRFAESGETRKYDLVVGADGLQSRTRRMVWGKETDGERVKSLGMYGGFFSMPRGETDTEWRRWYHAPGRRGIMLRPDGTGKRTTATMTLVSEDQRLENAAVTGRGGVDAQKILMEEYYRGVGWESERVLGEMEKAEDFYYDMIAQVKMERWSKGRVVLLGDAGYCASPLSGMGTTLALVGAYNLAGALLHHTSDQGAAFAAYEEKMRPVVDKAQKLAPGIKTILHPATQWGVWAMLLFSYFIASSGVGKLLAKFFGPPAESVSVEEYGFRELPEPAS